MNKGGTIEVKGRGVVTIIDGRIKSIERQK